MSAVAQCCFVANRKLKLWEVKILGQHHPAALTHKVPCSGIKIPIAWCWSFPWCLYSFYQRAKDHLDHEVIASNSQKRGRKTFFRRVSLCSATTELHCLRARGCRLLVNTEFLKCHCNTGKMLSQKVAKVTESRHCKYQPTQVLINDRNKIYLTKSIIITDNTVYPQWPGAVNSDKKRMCADIIHVSEPLAIPEYFDGNM